MPLITFSEIIIEFKFGWNCGRTPFPWVRYKSEMYYINLLFVTDPQPFLMHKFCNIQTFLAKTFQQILVPTVMCVLQFWVRSRNQMYYINCTFITDPSLCHHRYQYIHLSYDRTNEVWNAYFWSVRISITL